MQTTSSPISPAPSPPSRRRLALTAWALIAALQATLAYLAASGAGDGSALDLYRYEAAVGATVVYAVLVGLTVAIARLDGGVRETLGLRRFHGRWAWIALGVVVAVAILTLALAKLFGLDAGEEQGYLPDEWRPDRVGPVVANGLVVALVAPFAEELFFRGLGVTVLAGAGTAAAIVVSGLAFGLAHGLLIGLVPLTLFGIGLAWVRIRSASVWPGVIAHALYNASALAIAVGCLATDCADAAARAG